MAEYIDREAAVKSVLRMRRPENSVTQNRMLSIIQMDMLKLPAADVATVVLGHWKKDRDTIKCTVCGFGMFPNRYTFMHGVCVTDNKLPKYCENCGAKMGTTEEQSV